MAKPLLAGLDKHYNPITTHLVLRNEDDDLNDDIKQGIAFTANNSKKASYLGSEKHLIVAVRDNSDDDAKIANQVGA